MTLIVDNSADRNSYLTVAEADTLKGSIVQPTSVWSVEYGKLSDGDDSTTAEATNKLESSLRVGAVLLNSLLYVGKKKDLDQLLAFPRIDGVTNSGEAFDDEFIPKVIKLASLELACYQLNGNIEEGGAGSPISQGIAAASLGPISVSFDKSLEANEELFKRAVPNSIHELIRTQLKEFLRGASSGNEFYTYKLKSISESTERYQASGI